MESLWVKNKFAALLERIQERQMITRHGKLIACLDWHSGAVCRRPRSIWNCGAAAAQGVIGSDTRGHGAHHWGSRFSAALAASA